MKIRLIKPTFKSIAVRISIPALISILLFTSAIYLFMLPMFEKHLMERKKDIAREVVNSAWSLLATYNERAQSGELTLQEAQYRAKERLRHMRYGIESKDYFWINDQRPFMIMHPYRPELEGTDLSNYSDPVGTRLFVEAVKVVKEKGSGHIEYMWQWKDNETRIVPKISYVKGFSPWGWVVGSGVYVEDVYAEINLILKKVSVVALAILSVLFVLSGYIVFQSIKAERQRKKTELALHRSEGKYRELVESANSIILRWKPSGKITYINEFALHLFGYQKEELLGKNIIGTIVPEQESSGRDLSALMCEISKQPDCFNSHENENICKDGRRVWISWTNKTLHNDDNTASEILSVGNDITKRKQSDEQLMRLSTAIEQANESIVITDTEATIQYVSPNYCKIFGGTEKEILGKPFFPLIHDDDVEAVRASIAALKNPPYSTYHEERAKTIDGWRWFGWSLKASVDNEGNMLETIGVGRDITERKQSEDALRESEMINRSMLEGTPVCNKIIDLDFKLQYMSSAGIELLKITDINSFYGQDYPPEFFCEETRITITGKLKIALKGEISQVECLTHDTEGNELWFVHTFVPVFDGDGRVKYLIGSSVDITDRKRAEKERIQLTIAIEQTDETVVITEKLGGIIYTNPAFECISGYTVEESVGKNINFIKSGKHGESFYEQIWKTISKGQTWKGYLKNKKKDGNLYDNAATISPIKNPDGEIIGFVNIGRDVTNDLKIQEQLRQAQKMESIGTLAGGIAHDFNNILGIILGYTELSLDDVEDRPETYSSLQEVLKATKRAKDMVSQILTFSRSTDVEKKIIKTIPIVKEACKFLRSSLSTTIEIRQNITTERDHILADPTQFHQILMNLCTNAGHAMQKEGGVLDVALDEVFIQNDDLISYPDLKVGAYLKLTVKDTGTGILRENIERIFEPYFTTKGKGEGTGLGLAVVHGIVKEHEGNIKAYSEMGKGTAFYVFLPLREEIRSPVHRESTEPPPTGSETILFLDDEEDLVNIGKLTLEGLGYTVTGVTSVEKALEFFRSSKESYDIVITDKNMPKMTGFGFAREIRSISPDIPILLCTGFKEKEDEEKSKDLRINAVITKPINKQEIAFAVRKALDKKTA